MAEIIVNGGTLPQKEVDRYIAYVRDKIYPQALEKLEIKVDGDYVDLTWRCTPQKFERIRRITGYLVGTTDRWNNAKRAEERDRVKHI